MKANMNTAVAGGQQAYDSIFRTLDGDCGAILPSKRLLHYLRVACEHRS
jgi:hypothetical protein